MTHPLDNALKLGISLMAVVFVTLVVGITIVNYILLGSIAPTPLIPQPTTINYTTDNFTISNNPSYGGGHAGMEHIENCHRNTTLTWRDANALCWYKGEVCSSDTGGGGGVGLKPTPIDGS